MTSTKQAGVTYLAFRWQVSPKLASASRRDAATLHGFTLVELLVVIAIIGILVALLLPAIQASRESARRVMCTNQIHQLIIAVHDYEMAHEHYPSGTVDAAGPIRNLPKGHHISWIARILPYLEEGAVYGHLDLSLSAYHHKNDTARQATLALLMCPSNPGNEGPYSNYAGCHHDVEAPIDTNNHGVFFLNSQITRDDLTDGTAHTLFIGEKNSNDTDLGWLSGTPGTLRNTGSPILASRWGTGGLPWQFGYLSNDGQWTWDNKQVDPITGEFVTVEPSGAGAESEAQSADTLVADVTAAAEKQETPPEDTTVNEKTNSRNPALEPDANGMLKHSKLGGNGKNPLAVGGFSSSHPGGVNFAFGDGSVRFIADNVSASLMGRLAHRADGNIVDARELP